MVPSHRQHSRSLKDDGYILSGKHMMISLTIAALQLNPTMGALTHNADHIAAAAWQAYKQEQAQLVITPELALSGYPAEDLLLREDFLHSIKTTLVSLCQQLPPIDVILGLPLQQHEKVYNGLVYIRAGQIIATYHKQILPNYGVFDDRRHFLPGHQALIVESHGIKLGVAICEDFWEPTVALACQQAGAELLITINASPFDQEKVALREMTMQERVTETGLPLIYTGCVGGQDEIVYDGHSFALDAQGHVIARAEGFKTNTMVIHAQKQGTTMTLTAKTPLYPIADPSAQIYQALVLALRDYVHKNGFPGVLLGLSGGIDSALAACIAVDALGKDAVLGVLLPSRHTADISNEDALLLAKALGICTHTLPIDPVVIALEQSLDPLFIGKSRDKTEENLQARARGVLLMGLSNKFGALLLATSNKSESAVGYATLYGDMAGGFAPIKDVYKTQVYALARYRNQLNPVIPERTLTRAPTAELAPNQADSDTLPDYAVLDAMLTGFIEQGQSVADLVKAGFEATEVKRIITMVSRNEYKRRQAALGPKISTCAFGKDRRMPITQRFFE